MTFGRLSIEVRVRAPVAGMIYLDGRRHRPKATEAGAGCCRLRVRAWLDRVTGAVLIALGLQIATEA